jgi:hypothetical protein
MAPRPYSFTPMLSPSGISYQPWLNTACHHSSRQAVQQFDKSTFAFLYSKESR